MAKILLLPPFSLVAETLQEFDKNLVESFGLLQIHHMPRTGNDFHLCSRQQASQRPCMFNRHRVVKFSSDHQRRQPTNKTLI